MRGNRKNRVYDYIVEATKEYLEDATDTRSSFDTKVIALDLNLDRANVSRDLNAMWSEGILTKVPGRPTVYLHRETLSTKFPNVFFSAILTKEEFSSIIESSLTGSVISEVNESMTSIDKMIGHDGSLQNQISMGKAAVLYPPHGLHMCIIGNTGVGKRKFAEDLHEFSMIRKAKQTGPFIIINCSDYLDSASNFAAQLLGSAKGTSVLSIDKTKRGILELAIDGMIYFDDVTKLPSDALNLLVTIIEKNAYSRVGETQIRPLETMFVFAVRTEKDTHTSSLLKYVPVKIVLPDIENRGLLEKIQLLLSFFSVEAKSIQLPLRFSKDILVLFALLVYKDNLGQIKSEIKMTCSRAYLDAINTRQKSIIIQHHHLSNDLLEQSLNENDNLLRINRILSSFKNDVILINEDGSSGIIDHFQNSPRFYADQRIKQFINSFDNNVELISSFEDYASENIMCLHNCGKSQLDAVKRSINPIVLQVFNRNISGIAKLDELRNHFHLLYGVLLHLSNAVKRVDRKDYVLSSLNKESIVNETSEFVLLAKKIFDELTNILHFNFPNEEIHYLATYLEVARSWVLENKPSIIVICHGDDIASKMVRFIKDNYPGSYTLEALNYPSNLQFNDLIEILEQKCLQLDNGAGVNLVVDLHPLIHVHECVRLNTNVKTRIYHPASVNLILDLIDGTTKSGSQVDKLHSQSSMSSIRMIEVPNPFVERLISDFLEKSVTFLNAKKAAHLLNESLQKINDELGLADNNEIAVKFLCHCVHMIERVILKNSFSFPHLLQFNNKYSKEIRIIEKHLKIPSEAFGISIPSSEIAYVTEIFLNYMNT